MGIMAIAAGIMAILGAIFRPSPPPPPPAPVRTVSAPVVPAVTAPKPDVTKAAAGVAAAGAAAAAATKAAAADTAQAVDATAAKAAATVAGAADVVSDETAKAARKVTEVMGAEDLTLLRLGLSDDVIEGLPADVTANLAAAGVQTPADLLRLASTPGGRSQLAAATGIPESAILRWANQLDLRRVKGVGEMYAILLEASGVDTVPELAQRNAANLLNRMTAVNSEQSIVERMPTLADVESWVRQAKELPRIITY
jgi:predicted flap endonuclease-1-like 5' DNA nuclease